MFCKFRCWSILEDSSGSHSAIHEAERHLIEQVSFIDVGLFQQLTITSPHKVSAVQMHVACILKDLQQDTRT